MAQLIRIDEIKEGMTLAEPVVNKYGQTLLPSGTELNEQKGKILKTWNIKTIAVKAEDSEDEVEITKEMLDRAEEKLLKKMSWDPRNHFENDLFKSVALYLAKTQNNKEKD